MYCESTEFMNQGTLAYHVALLHLSAIFVVCLGKLSSIFFIFCRFLSPLSAVPLVALVGFGLYELGFPGVSSPFATFSCTCLLCIKILLPVGY